MALLFDDANSQRLARADALGLTTWPLTISVWFNRDAAIQVCLLALSDSAVTNEYVRLTLSAGGAVVAGVAGGGTEATATTSTTFTDNTWNHACGLFAADASRSALLNGAGKVTDTTNRTWAVDSSPITRIGAFQNSTLFMSGRLADVGVWNALLDDVEVAALAKGFSPRLIRPTSLVAYLPLVREAISGTTHLDRWRNRFDFTEAGTGSPALADPPRLYRQTGPRYAQRTFNGVRFASPVGINLTLPDPAMSIMRAPRAVQVSVVAQQARPATLPARYVGIEIGGAFRELSTFVPSLVTTEALNQEPDTAAFTLKVVKGAITPIEGQEVIITFDGERLFGGHVMRVRQVYEGQKRQLVAWSVECSDYGWLLNRRLVRKRYTAMSATAILLDLIGSFSSGFTTANVAAGLPTIDEIEFTDETLSNAMTRVVQRIGGYFYIDATKDVHAFLEETDSTLLPLDEDNRTFEDLDVERDLTPVRNRVYVEGHGSQAATDVTAGFTTLPVEDGSPYSSGGGTVKSGPQHITYTGKDGTTPGGSIVGTPVEAPDVGSTSAADNGAGSMDGSALYRYVVTFETSEGETDGSEQIQVTTSAGAGRAVLVSNIPTASNPAVIRRHVYRSAGGGTTLFRRQTFNDNVTTSLADFAADNDGVFDFTKSPPTTNGAGYSTPIVEPGSTSLAVASAAPFPNPSGWVSAGDQLIRYTGLTSNTLTGVPASGTGSIISPIPAGTPVLSVPHLTGIPASGAGSIAYPVLKGDDVNVIAQTDATAAQTELAGAEGGDGIHEHPVQDNRLSLASAETRGQAELDLFARPVRTIRYATRDRRTRAGKTIHVDLGAPTNIVGDFKIQRVSRSQIGVNRDLDPLCAVEASSVKFSLEDLLRRAEIDQA